MKKIYTLLMTALFVAFPLSHNVSGQSPNQFSYQAVVRNASGELVKNTTIGMRISILKGSASGSAVYTETHSPETNVNGLVTVVIGDGTTADDMATIDWSDGPYFLKTETDPDGGTGYTITSATQLLSVPYALYAEKSGDSFSGVYNDLSGKPDLTGMVQVSGATDGDMLYYDGGEWNRLGKGSEGTMLTMQSDVPVWKTAGATHIQSYFQFVTYKSGSSSPIAFGFINADGTIASGSGNFTCSWSGDHYVITIDSQTYFWTSYTTVATLTSHSSALGANIQTGSVGGSLLVYVVK